MTPPGDLPVVIVGDVHGDLERLFTALRPYPPDRWRTIFLGDLVDGGDFGVGALRYSRDRPNSEVLIGNHEVAMLWALREPAAVASWLWMGGQPHDLEELRRDHGLQGWMRGRPAMVLLPDGTLVQHSDNDLYTELAEGDQEDLADAVNTQARALLEARQEQVLWDVLTPGSFFRPNRPRLERYLARARARRLVHGHKPHLKSEPDPYHAGLAISFDGSLSRGRGGRFRSNRSVAATVGPLPPLVS